MTLERVRQTGVLLVLSLVASLGYFSAVVVDYVFDRFRVGGGCKSERLQPLLMRELCRERKGACHLRCLSLIVQRMIKSGGGSN